MIKHHRQSMSLLGKRFVKVDGDVTSDQTLAGAEFVVRDQDSDTAKYLSIDPSTKAVSWVSAKESAMVLQPQVTV